MDKVLKWLGVEEAFKKGLISQIIVILCFLFIIFGIVFVTIRVVMTVHPALPAAHWTDMLIESMILIIGLFSLWLIRKDHMRATSRILLGCILLAVSMQAYFIGDPANDVAGAMGLLLFAMLAIIMLDRWDRVIAVGLVVIVFVVLNIMATSGNLEPVVNLTPLGKTFFSFFIWLTVSILIALLLVAASAAMRREPRLLQQRLAGSEGIENADRLLYLSTHDGLTDLYNRLFFETEFKRLEKSRQYPISIIITDIDHLENINDAYGNLAGDQMIIDVARLLVKVFRQEDVVSRYGEDEFAILLPQTDTSIIDIIMKRIDKQISSYNKKHSQRPMSLTFGYSTAEKGDSLKNHLKIAKKNLIKAKENKM